MFHFLKNLTKSTTSYFQSGTNQNDTTDCVSNEYTLHTPRRNSPNKDLLESIHKTAEKAKTAVTEGKPLEDLKTIFNKFPFATEVINLRDSSGYTLLQHAIIAGRAPVVHYLVTLGAELNTPICGRPVHLAAKLGQADILKLILEFNGDPYVLACVCYPEKHREAANVFSPLRRMWYSSCAGDVFVEDKFVGLQTLSSMVFDYPLYYAIQADSVECVTLLLTRNLCQLRSNIPVLHLSCLLGSEKCVRYFVETKPKLVFKKDSKGFFPIQYAVRWGKNIVQYLILHGSSVMVQTSNNETLLHLLFRDLQMSCPLTETVNHLLECGLKMNINILDSAGNTALSLFLKRLNDQPMKYLGSEHNSSDCDSVIEEIQEYVSTLELLLRAGSNPNVANRVGDTSLHIACRVRSPQVSSLPRELPVPRHARMKLICSTLSTLLEAGANPNFVNNSEGSVLWLLVSHVCAALFGENPVDFQLPDDIEVNYFIQCLKILHKQGCEFHCSRFVGNGCLLHCVLTLLDKLDQLPRLPFTQVEQAEMASTFVSFVKAITQVLLECGSLPNMCQCNQTDLHYLYYKLISQHRILSLPQIQEFIMLLLRHGADPSTGGKHIPMSVFRCRSSFSYWPVFPLLHILNLIGSKDMIDKEAELVGLFGVFYNTMDENNANQCIFHYLEYDRYKGRTSKYPELDSYLMQVLNNPRKLKQICATFIYKSLADKRVDKLKCLALPKILVTYISNFQY